MAIKSSKRWTYRCTHPYIYFVHIHYSIHILHNILVICQKRYMLYHIRVPVYILNFIHNLQIFWGRVRPTCRIRTSICSRTNETNLSKSLERLEDTPQMLLRCHHKKLSMHEMSDPGMRVTWFAQVCCEMTTDPFTRLWGRGHHKLKNKGVCYVCTDTRDCTIRTGWIPWSDVKLAKSS